MTYGLLPGADQREVAVEGVRFAVNVAGPRRPPLDATPVLLLHGVPQSAVAFRFLLPELARDRVVLAPDLKGLGGSEIAAPYDVATLVRELAALALHEFDGPVDVVGHDWGGSLAIALAGARPDLVRRLVVVNAPYRRLDLTRASYIPFFLLPGLPEVAFRLGGRRLIRWIFSRLWKVERPLDRVALTHYERVYTDPARIAAMLGYYRANLRSKVISLASGRGPGTPSRVTADRLVVWGAADPVLPMSVAEAAVRDLGPGTELVSFPGVGHFPLEEAAEDVVPVIARFLRGADEPLPLPEGNRPGGREPVSVTLGMPSTPPPGEG